MTDSPYIGPERQLPEWAGPPPIKWKPNYDGAVFTQEGLREAREFLVKEIKPVVYAGTVQFTGIQRLPSQITPENVEEHMRQTVEQIKARLEENLFRDAMGLPIPIPTLPPLTRRERIVRWLRYQRRRFATQLHRLGVWIDADSWSECDHAGDHGYW